MKRTSFINCVISSSLGAAVGAFLQLAVSQSSIWFGILTIVATIGLVLNSLCGYDTSNEDEKK